MKRRCKAGDRARIIKGGDEGKIVVVVRKYHGERLGGYHWAEVLFPWVVAAIGAPLNFVIRGKPPKNISVRVGVYEDSDLEPLREDDPGIDESTQTDKPTTLPAKSQAAMPASKGLERTT